jgi:hypothetical protein
MPNGDPGTTLSTGMISAVHVLLTYRCTLECDHCFVHGGPEARGTFTLDRVRELLDQTADVPSVEWIYFEGGEPFLFHPLLVASVREARVRGFRVGVVSNGYWAESEEDAELWLRPLAELGVDDLSLSDDPLHHGDTTPSPAVVAAEAADRLGIPVDLLRVPRPGEGDGLTLRGRAVDRLAPDLPMKPWLCFISCDTEELRSPDRVHVDVWGHVQPCPGISMGCVWERPLESILSGWKPDAHPVCGPLLAGGPVELAAHHGLQPRARGYASGCHLCYDLRARLRERMPDVLAPPQAYGIIEA